MTISWTKESYFEQVWSFVRQVPEGKVVTYGQIAQTLPDPPVPDTGEMVSAARLVGSAMAASPADVPWHRVINAQGRVSNRADAAKQLELLEAEGLCFVHGRIDLAEHLWHDTNQIAPPKQHQLF